MKKKNNAALSSRFEFFENSKHIYRTSTVSSVLIHTGWMDAMYLQSYVPLLLFCILRHHLLPSFFSSSFSDVSHLFASAHPKLHVKNDFLRFVWLCVSYRGPTVRFKIDPHWILCHTKSKIASFSYYIWRNEGFLEACGTFIEHLCAIFPIFSIFFFSFRSSQMIIVKLAFWLFE